MSSTLRNGLGLGGRYLGFEGNDFEHHLDSEEASEDHVEDVHGIVEGSSLLIVLQEKIRKLKCPLAVDFTVLPEHIPSQIMESEGDFLSAYRLFCKELLKGLKDTIPAIRFNAAWFTGFGIDGMYLLQELLSYGKSLGYYILLDWAELLSPISVTSVAENLFDENNTWQFDGLTTPASFRSLKFDRYFVYRKRCDPSLCGKAEG